MNYWSEWTARDVATIFAQLGTSEHGLSSSDAAQKLKQYGPNNLPRSNGYALTILLQQIRSPFNYLLLAAAFISCITGKWESGLLILLLSTINLGIGFYQEFKAHRALILLHKFMQLEVRVIREGKEFTIDKTMLVPGDIIILDTGNTVPADARIIDAQSLMIDESILTGESMPVAKGAETEQQSVKDIFKARNIVFAGTTIASGYGHAVAVATGQQMEMVSITGKSNTEPRLSTYERNLIKLSNLLLRVALIIIVVVFVTQLTLKQTSNISTLIIFFITLIVALVPIALPTVITFSLSQAALLLAHKKVIVKRLSAIEDLGDLEILCVDKTGTLTEYELTVDQVVAADSTRCILFALLGDNHSNVVHKKVHGGVFYEGLATYASDEVRTRAAQYSILSIQPFDPHRMFMSVLAANEQHENFLIVRGAPEVILGLCSSIEGNRSRSHVLQDIRAQGKSGKRILAVAYKKTASSMFTHDDEKDLSFVGFVSFVNPIKKGVPETLVLAQKMGVSIKMITGDSPEVAGFVAHAVGLITNPEDVIQGSALDALSDQELEQTCLEKSVFARIDPSLKARIIGALQMHAEVGFLGEGMNDVPALRQANIALVVKEAVDVARDSADIILLQPDIHVMINGIRYGRIIFANISKYIKCSLASSFGNYYSVALFSLILPFLPLLPTQILLINLLSDFPLVAIASDTVDPRELITPKSYQLKRTMLLIVFLGFIGTLTDFIFFSFFRQHSPEVFRSLWFMFNIFSAIALIFCVRAPGFFLRTRRPSWQLISTSLFSLCICIALPWTTIGQRWFLLVPPARHDYIILIGLLAVFFCMSELVKLTYMRYVNNHSTDA